MAGRLMRIGLWSLVAVLAVSFAAIAYSLVNPNSLKPLASWLTETLTGRTLTIAGDFDFDLSTRPTVSARQVSFGNAPWSSEPQMATASGVSVQIDLAALFDQRVHLIHLEADALTLTLEDRVDGDPNWVLFEDDGSETEWGLMIEGMRLENARILASIGDLEPIDLQIPELIEASDAAGILTLDGHGTLNGDAWRIDGSIGTLDALIAGGRIELDMTLALDEAEISARGQIGDLNTMSGLDLTLEMLGPDVEVLGEILGMREAFLGDLALTGTIAPEGDGHAVAVEGRIAAFQIQTRGTILNMAEFDGWDGFFDIRGPDAGIFGKTLQIRGFPEGPFQVAGRLRRFGGDLDITDLKVITDAIQVEGSADFADFPRREGAVANLHLHGQDLGQLGALTRLERLPSVPFDLTMNLKGTEGDLTARLEVGNHALEVDGYLGEFPDYLGTRLNVKAAGDDLDRVLKIVAPGDLLRGPYDAEFLLIRTEKGLAASGLEASNDPFHFEGEVTLPDPTRPKAAVVDGRLTVKSLATAGHLFDLDGLPDEAASIEASLTTDDGAIRIERSAIRYLTMNATAAGSAGVPFTLASLSGQFTIEGPSFADLLGTTLPEGQEPLPFRIESTIRGRADGLELEEFTLDGPGGEIGVTGLIALPDPETGTRLSIRGGGSSLADTIPVVLDYEPPDHSWEMVADVHLPGRNHASIERGILEVGSLRVEITGTVDAGEHHSTDLTVDIRGDTMQDLGRFSDAEFPDIPFYIAGKLDGSLTGINVTQLDAEWGESDLEASGSVELGEIPTIVLKGRSKTMNLVELQQALFGTREDADPSDDAVTLIPDTPIPMEGLQGYNADVDIQVETFRGRRASLDDIALALNVQDGTLVLDELAYRDAVGSFQATARLAPQDDKARLRFTLRGEDAKLGWFVSAEQAEETAPRYSMNVDITGTGATVAEIAGSLNGHVLLSSDGGQIDNAALELFAGDFITNVLEVLNPFSDGSRFTQMDCMVVNARIVDGLVEMEPGFVMRTDRVNMFVYGKANLKNERLDLSLATQARRGIGISAASITNPYFKVGGTLAEPALQLDPTSAAIAASVATATAGLSIVIRGIWERLLGSQDPCPQFREYQQKPIENGEG
jgi:uncharacterized protein involved in outer membrane biogenesis